MVDRETGQVPLFAKSVEEPLEVTCRAGEVGLCHLDVVETDDRIDGKGRYARPLADHLPMDLAVRRDINDHVVLDVGGAAQPLTHDERPLALVVELDWPGWRQPVVTGFYPGPASHHYLASAAQTAAPAHRVEVDAQGPGRVEDGGSVGERSSPP